MALLDWAILCFYFLGLVGLSFWIGLRQKDGEDYFLGGRRLHSSLIALSLAANQVSAISLIGAPAFVAIRQGGGMRWLQYEFAVPLAMIAIMFVLVPLYRRLTGASIFEYLHNRFGTPVRLALSGIFMLSRGLATGVVLYASALVLSVVLEIDIATTLILMGTISILYTYLGGITADILSDAFQLLILFLGTLVALFVVLNLVGGFGPAIEQVSGDRLQTIDFAHHGFGDGEDYAFWPMLIGGFFLYFSYYGCDQSQGQRLMSAPNTRSSQNSLLLNGLIRFPVVLVYCVFGLLLAAFISSRPEWVAQNGILDDPNRLVPAFIVDYLPIGVVGLVMAGLFAATMSSIDSNLNSLSAVSMDDFIARKFPALKENRQLYLTLSRLLTVFWGVFCLVSGYYLSRTSDTVIELVNKLGSAFYGPVLAVFVAGAFLSRARSLGVLVGLGGGLLVNIVLMFFFPAVSWLWWNPIGFFAALAVTMAASHLQGPVKRDKAYWTLRNVLSTKPREVHWLLDLRTWALLGAFAAILAVTVLLGMLTG